MIRTLGGGFANGDASQLLPSSKQRLLKGLESLSKIDPFFRRMDSWRRFNVAGFFSSDMIEHVRPLLASAHAQSHLRGLLLELLHGTEAAIGLQQEFRAILLDPQVEMTERMQAYRNLDAISENDPVADFDALVGQASRDSLEIAGEMIEKRGIGQFGRARVLQLVNALSQLYPADGVRHRSVGSHYFIRLLIGTFELGDTRYLLDEIIAFATRYIEPQLARAEDSATRAYMLDHGPAFSKVKGQLALDWLTRYPGMPSATRETLFGIAAAHADRTHLNALIAGRCNSTIDASEAGKKLRKFWLLRYFFFIVPTSDTLWTELSADPKSIFEIEQYAGRMGRHDAQGWPQLNADQVFRVIDAFATSWPKVDLPNSWGTGDPEDETAYRFLTDLVFQIAQDDPSNSVPVFDRILSDDRFSEFHSSIRSMKATAVRQLALSGFEIPRPVDVARLLDESKIATVEDMRAVLIELLDEIQGRLKGAATNPVDVFYSGNDRVNENTARNRIVDMLEARLNAMHLGVVIEHQMADAKRCDFTASTSINGSQTVLVTEVKGQWNPELFTAASAQLAERYTIYPGAADQGVYLVLWFGGGEIVAAKQAPSITSAAELREEIVAKMPEDLRGRIDIYVLDVSRAS